MAEQSDLGKPDPGKASVPEPVSTTTVSDASLDKFARIFEASAKRWEVIVYPSLMAFIVLAAYGFYLIYSMTSDVHRVTGQMDTIVHAMVVVADNMVRVTGNMTTMTANINTMTQEMVHVGKSFDEGVDIASRMDQKFEVIVPIAHRMQVDADVMTRRMQDMTRPMGFMSDMFPNGD